MRYLVTGGLGFIGSNFLHRMVRARPGDLFINVDCGGYAANEASVADLTSSGNYRFEKVDLADGAAVREIFHRHRPDRVIHFAAESHVDRSIRGPDRFVASNVLGTYHLLEAARECWEGERTQTRFHHVSTDEVFGALGPTGRFNEETRYDPSSPYSATKAASDHLAMAWHRTFGLPVTLSHCSNNYGPRQHPEKLIPLMVLNAAAGESLPVYGKGANVRDWLHVDDHCRAIECILERGVPGRSYALGGGTELSNLEVVQRICAEVARRTNRPVDAVQRLIRFVDDRPGHDFRYAIDSRRAREELDWSPRVSFEAGLAATVDWYFENPDWCATATGGEYARWKELHYRAGSGT